MVLTVKYLSYKDYIEEANLVMCLGFFDGMHIAHKKLIEEAKKIAKEKNLSLAVLTFTQSIMDYVNKKEYFCLTTIDDKSDICRKMEIDYLYVIKVDDNLIHLSANEFIDKCLKKANTLVFGFDFNFGYLGEGNKDLLNSLNLFKTVVIPEMKFKNIKVGTSRIKNNLKQGELETAKNMLGRYYSIKGKIIKGRGIGKELGYPTANLERIPYLVPKCGVYLTKVYIDNKKYFGLTNIGIKPTFRNLSETIETFIFDFDNNIYDKIMKIEFLEYVREEKRFINHQDLIKQIANDILYYRNIVKEKYYD